MRKSWRWILGTAAAIIALLALFVWDAIRRAEAAIDAHERQVALDIAALRAAHARRLPIPVGLQNPSTGQAFSPDRLEKIRKLNESGVFYEYEKDDPYEDLVDNLGFYLRMGPRFPELPLPSPEITLATLAFPQDVLRGGGFDRADRRQALEREAIGKWKMLIETGRLSGAELGHCAGTMDHLLQTRTSLREALEGERAMDRRRVIQVLRTRSDKHSTLTNGPSWRSLLLWRVFIAKTLTAIDRMYRDFGEVESLPTHQRYAAAIQIEEEILKAGRYPPISSWRGCQPVASLCVNETETLRDWSLMRLATAIAWFEADHGRFPGKLEDLAPGYIERVPLCPATGLPFSYSNGALTAAYEPGKSITWRVARKK